MRNVKCEIMQRALVTSRGATHDTCRAITHFAFRISNSPSGFTILEAIVALTVTGLVAISAMGAIGAELRAATRARTSLAAAALAEDRLAAIALLSERELEALPDSLARGQFAPPFGDFQWTAATRRDPAMVELLDVAVEVTWIDGRYPMRIRLFRPRFEPARDLRNPQSAIRNPQ
jgi:type II secretory pathway pseudopilin PulG